MPPASPAAAPAAPVTPAAPKPAASLKASDSLGKGNRAAAIAQLDAAAGSSEAAEEAVEAGAAADIAEIAAATPAAKPNGAADPHKAAREQVDRDYAEFTRRTKQLSETRANRDRARQEEAQRRSETEAHSRQIAAARLADEDPFAYLESRGITAEELVKRGITRGSPEAKVEAKLAELETWKQQQAQLAKQQAEQQAHAQAQQQYFAARQYLESLVDKHHVDYPTLDFLAPSYVSYQAYQLSKQYFEDTGEVPSEKVARQILAFLEKTEQDARAERQKRRTPAAGGTPPGPKKPPPPATLPAPKKGQSLRDQRRERGLAILDRASRESE